MLIFLPRSGNAFEHRLPWPERCGTQAIRGNKNHLFVPMLSASLNLQPSEFRHSHGELIGAEILFDHSAIIDLANRTQLLN